MPERFNPRLRELLVNNFGEIPKFYSYAEDFTSYKIAFQDLQNGFFRLEEDDRFPRYFIDGLVLDPKIGAAVFREYQLAWPQIDPKPLENEHLLSSAIEYWNGETKLKYSLDYQAHYQVRPQGFCYLPKSTLVEVSYFPDLRYEVLTARAFFQEDEIKWVQVSDRNFTDLEEYYQKLAAEKENALARGKIICDCTFPGIKFVVDESGTKIIAYDSNKVPEISLGRILLGQIFIPKSSPYGFNIKSCDQKLAITRVDLLNVKPWELGLKPKINLSELDLLIRDENLGWQNLKDFFPVSLL